MLGALKLTRKACTDFHLAEAARWFLEGRFLRWIAILKSLFLAFSGSLNRLYDRFTEIGKHPGTSDLKRHVMISKTSRTS